MLNRDSVSVCFGRYLPGPGVMSRRFCSGKRSAVVCMRPECACPLRSDSTRVPAKLPSGERSASFEAEISPPGKQEQERKKN